MEFNELEEEGISVFISVRFFGVESIQVALSHENRDFAAVTARAEGREASRSRASRALDYIRGQIRSVFPRWRR